MVCHIFVNGEIGNYTSPESFRAQVDKTADSYVIHINSEGGDVYDGYQIGNIILNLGKPVTAIVEGLCASISTYIACCADKIIMTPQSTWVIHDPTASTSGRAQDLISAASQLLKMKSEIIARYMTKLKGKKSQDELSDAMDKETSLDANDALQWGFADSIQERLKAVAKIDFKKFNMKNEEKDQSFLKELSGVLSKHFGWKQKEEEIVKPENKKKEEKPVSKKETPKNSRPVAKKKVKYVSVVTLTLTDGTTIEAEAADPNNLVGAPVSTTDGSELADGVYETTDSDEITVAGGVIEEVEQDAENKTVMDDEDSDAKNPNENLDPEDDDAEPVDESDDNPDEDNDPKVPTTDPDVIKKLKDEIAKLQQQMKASAKKEFDFRNEINELKKKTIGDSLPPKKGNAPIAAEHDDDIYQNGMFSAMQGDVIRAFKARKIINED